MPLSLRRRLFASAAVAVAGVVVASVVAVLGVAFGIGPGRAQDAPGGRRVSQSTSPVQRREMTLESPWGRQRVQILYPRTADAEAPGRWPVLVALHGAGEARRGPDRGPEGWPADYRLDRAFGALLRRRGRGPLRAEDFLGLARPERLRAANAALRARPFEGVMVVCPYTPHLMREELRSAEVAAYASWVAGPLLAAVYVRFPNAARGRAATGIDGVSLGGFLSLAVGLLRPEAFASVGALQPAIAGRVGAFADLAEEAARGSAREARPLHLRLLSSDADPFLRPTRALSEALRRRGVAHELSVVPGDHSYEFNRAAGGMEMLLFHEPRLRRGP